MARICHVVVLPRCENISYLVDRTIIVQYLREPGKDVIYVFVNWKTEESYHNLDFTQVC